MLSMNELRDKMKECLQEVDFFTTAELKELLKESGYVYNIDYDVNAFSNAVSSLAKQKYIVSLDSKRKGNYRVNHEGSSDRSYNTAGKSEKQKNANTERNSSSDVHGGNGDDEPELQEMRQKIKERLKAAYEEIEQLFDSEKPSKYGRNRKTYDDILKLLDYLKHFHFSNEDYI